MDPLSDVEIRVLGVLLEKAVTTPDQYPLTLNAVISACNQKSSREPVMSLAQGEVQRALRLLEDKLLVSTDPNLRGRVEKYMQRFCKPPFGIYDFDSAQYAVLTVLMLRGPATPGELRTRTDRMHRFADNEAVVQTLQALANWDAGPLVAVLPRAPNRRDASWAQLFGEDAAGYEAQSQGSPTSTPATSAPPAADQPASVAQDTSASAPDVTADQLNRPASDTEAEQRITALEQRVSELEQALQAMQDRTSS